MPGRSKCCWSFMVAGQPFPSRYEGIIPERCRWITTRKAQDKSCSRSCWFSILGKRRQPSLYWTLCHWLWHGSHPPIWVKLWCAWGAWLDTFFGYKISQERNEISQSSCQCKFWADWQLQFYGKWLQKSCRTFLRWLRCWYNPTQVLGCYKCTIVCRFSRVC